MASHGWQRGLAGSMEIGTVHSKKVAVPAFVVRIPTREYPPERAGISLCTDINFSRSRISIRKAPYHWPVKLSTRPVMNEALWDF